MVASFILVSLLAAFSSAQKTDCVGVNAISPKCRSVEVPYTRDFFYVGGRALTVSTGELTADKLYVEKLTPTRGPYQSKPVVFSHGGGCTGATWVCIKPRKPVYKKREQQLTLD